MKNEIKNIPDNWEVKKLGEVCKIIAGQSPEGKYYNTEGKGIPFYQGKKEFTNFYLGQPQKWTTKITKEALKDDILMSVRAPVGPVNISTTKICIGRGLTAIRPNKKILRNFLFQFLIMYQSKLKGNTGAVFDSINQTQIKNIEIPIPPLAEQERIVAILDKVFSSIEKAKTNSAKNLQNAKELFESYLNNVFEKGKLKIESGEWEEKQLNDIALVFGRGKSKHRPRNWKGLFGGSYPFIQTGEVRNAHKYISSYSKSYNEIGLKQSKLWKKGTICITIAANIAETAILDLDACFPDSIIGLQVDSQKADLDFTYYLLQYFKTELQKLGKGSAQDNINLGTFENHFFPFPNSVIEQKQIAKKLDTLSSETKKLEAIYQKKNSSLEELKKSILQKAFNGGL